MTQLCASKVTLASASLHLHQPYNPKQPNLNQIWAKKARRARKARKVNRLPVKTSLTRSLKRRKTLEMRGLQDQEKTKTQANAVKKARRAKKVKREQIRLKSLSRLQRNKA